MKQLVDAKCSACQHTFTCVPIDEATKNFKCEGCDNSPGEPWQPFRGMRVVLGKLGIIPPLPKAPSSAANSAKPHCYCGVLGCCQPGSDGQIPHMAAGNDDLRRWREGVGPLPRRKPYEPFPPEERFNHIVEEGGGMIVSRRFAK